MVGFIREIEEAGRFVILVDSSKWEVSVIDRFYSRRWLVLDKVTVHLGKMTNHSQGDETVSVTQC